MALASPALAPPALAPPLKMDNSPADPSRILFRMPNWLGDAVMAAPAVESVRALYPEAFIGMAIKENIAELGAIMPSVDKVYPLPNPSAARRLVLREIFTENYQSLVIFPNSFRSAWEFWGGGIPHRAGYSGMVRSLLLTHALSRPPKHSVHQQDYFLSLVKSVFPDLAPAPSRIVPPDSAMEKSMKLLPHTSRPLVGIGFGATYGSAKMWPAERFAALIDSLAPHVDLALLGAPTDKDVEEKVTALATHKPVSLVGRTDIPTLAATLKRLNVYVTN
ncbi:MAG: glycosyltransferase family 9 protein, partial [Nitrospinota bacterium]|nr:glycosyltransferase family 9 protein [Nitrospinota bacterium]